MNYIAVLKQTITHTKSLKKIKAACLGLSPKSDPRSVSTEASGPCNHTGPEHSDLTGNFLLTTSSKCNT